MKSSTQGKILRPVVGCRQGFGTRFAARFAVLVLAFLVAGCGGFMRDKEMAASAMDQFHDRFNAADYDKIYDTADPAFQSSTTRADFLKFITAVHNKLGDYQHCANQGESVNTFNSNTSVTLRYKTTFAKGEGDEDFVFTISGTRALLKGYHINSTQLIAP